MTRLPPQRHHHRHSQGCWRVVFKCGKREHKEHTANCRYDEQRKRYGCGGLHAHDEKCYKKKLICKIYGTAK